MSSSPGFQPSSLPDPSALTMVHANSDPDCCFEAHIMFHIDKILDLAVRMNNRLQDLKTRIQYLDYEVQHIKTEQRKRNAEQADFDVAKDGNAKHARKFFREHPECSFVNAEDFPLVHTPKNRNGGVASSSKLSPTVPLGSPRTNSEGSEGF